MIRKPLCTAGAGYPGFERDVLQGQPEPEGQADPDELEGRFRERRQGMGGARLRRAVVRAPSAARRTRANASAPMTKTALRTSALEPNAELGPTRASRPMLPIQPRAAPMPMSGTASRPALMPMEPGATPRERSSVTSVRRR